MGLLVLSRRKGERICIGDNIEVILVESDRGSARIGILAPNDVIVDRLEVRDRKREAGDGDRHSD